MSANKKCGLSSSSPSFPSGQRGVYAAASLDRSGSFREGMENRIPSSRPSMSRSGPALSQGDVTNYFHSLPLDAKLMAAGQKLPRQVEINRAITASLGISLDDSHSGSSTTKLLPSSLEGIKRAKNTVHESAIRASDQAKIWGETISKFDKQFSSVWTRKRSRYDVQPSDRSNASLAGDRLVLGGVSAKMSTQSNVTLGRFDQEQQKLEEQTKSVVPNKRICTSIVDGQMDIRGSSLGRATAAIDRDREMFGLANGGHVQSEEKHQALPVDGWDKSKMRKKRSGIKLDVSMNAVGIRSPDGDRESKREIQQRLGIEARPRLNNVNGFRSGTSSGAVGVGKLDVTCQQTSGLGMRSTTRTDQDDGSLLSDRKDRLASADKEKLNLKAVNKLNMRESISPASPASTPKMNALTRGPRSGSGTIQKSSPNVHRAIGGPDDWELPQSTNKINAVGDSNRKRPPSTRSSSPPVAQWGGQRPQKISRVARRTNFVPFLSGHDEALATEKLSDVSGSESGLKHSLGNAVHQVRSKGDQFSSAAFSESEVSGAAEIRSKDKGRKSVEIDGKAGQNVQKIAPLVSSLRKNKMQDEDLGDTVRRHGRIGRNFTSARSGIRMAVEKLDNAVTAKQLRSARHGSAKIVSKVGRPPSRKLSDRKAYTRSRHTINCCVQELLGEPNDVHEELLAAANAAVNPVHACSSSFWRQMEPLFSVLSAEDIAYLKQQANFGSNLLIPTLGAVCRENCSIVPNRFELIECKRDMDLASEAKCPEHFSKQLVPRRDQDVIPLCQRLIAALVSEEENEVFCYREDDDLKFDANEVRFGLGAELKPNNMNQHSLGNFHPIGKPVSNGYRIPATAGRYHNGVVHDEFNFQAVPNTRTVSSFGDDSLNGLQTNNQEEMPSMPCSEFEYNQMSQEERLILELHSIGIFPDPVPDLAQSEDVEISEDVNRMEELNQLVTKKKSLLCKVEKSAMEARELQERDIERSAYEKLVVLVYNKYMACFGPNASCGKGASSKVAKQAALALVKRTLERCQKFEDFGESCFNEPVFQDLFRSGSSNLKISDCVDSIVEGESANLYANTPTLSSGIRVSGTDHIPSLISQSGHSNHDKYYLDCFQSLNHLSEERIGKEDKGLTKVKKRELLLDEVVGGTVSTSSRAHSGIGISLSSGTKGKRSERDREGKGQHREMLSRSSTAKIGRPSLGNVKGERKPKSKPKHKTTQLSASANGLLGKDPEPPKAVSTTVSRSCDINNTKKSDSGLGPPNDSEALDLSHLPLLGIDDLGVPDDLDGQGQDLSSWLNIDDDALQDIDFEGLEIPTDDLSDLKMMI